MDRELFDAVVNGDYYKSRSLIRSRSKCKYSDNRHRTLLDIIKNKRRYLVVPNKVKFIG